MTGMGILSRTQDQLFFIVIIETKQPGLAVDGLLPDDIIEMIVKPTFAALFFPFSVCIEIGQCDPEQGCIGEVCDIGLFSRLFQLPLADKELTVIAQLGIEQQ